MPWSFDICTSTIRPTEAARKVVRSTNARGDRRARAYSRLRALAQTAMTTCEIDPARRYRPDSCHGYGAAQVNDGRGIPRFRGNPEISGRPDGILRAERRSFSIREHRSGGASPGHLRRASPPCRPRTDPTLAIRDLGDAASRRIPSPIHRGSPDHPPDGSSVLNCWGLTRAIEFRHRLRRTKPRRISVRFCLGWACVASCVIVAGEGSHSRRVDSSGDGTCRRGIIGVWIPESVGATAC